MKPGDLAECLRKSGNIGIKKKVFSGAEPFVGS